MKRTKYFYILLTLLFLSCDKISKDDDLTIPLMDYTGDQLRIDGYYSQFYGSGIDERMNTCFFYRNGVVSCIGAYLVSEIDQTETYISDGTMHEWIKDNKLKWGAFLINENVIKFELIYPSSGGPFKAYTRQGTILNDTTFHITESYRMVDGEKTSWSAKNELYQFKQFSPKMDSINSIVP